MAAKKTTKSTTKSKTKTAAASKSKDVNITFAPIMSAATVFKMLLRKKEIDHIGGQEIPRTVPLIDGLPIEFRVKKGEVVTVTAEQFEQLQANGFAETDEEYKNRKKFIDSMSSQHPENLTWDMIVAEGGNWSTLADSQNIVYNDKLLRV